MLLIGRQNCPQQNVLWVVGKKWNSKDVIMKIKNIIVGWYRKIFNKKSELARKRLAICKDCPYKIKLCGQDICDLCGCVLDAKVRVENEQCYNNRW